MTEHTATYDAAHAADVSRLRLPEIENGAGIRDWRPADPPPYRALLTEIERASWRPEHVCPDGPLDTAPEQDWLTQGVAYARCPANMAERLRWAAKRADLAASRPDLANAPGALREVATLLRRLASEVTGGN